MNNNDHNVARRSFFKGGAALAAAAPFVGTLQAFAARQTQAATQVLPAAGPYGPVAPVKDKATGLELLQLPAGFNYTSFSWAGDLMADGQVIPPGHDGMGVIAVRRGRGGEEIVLVRNHELGTGKRIEAPAVFDDVTLSNGQQISGGNTNIYFPRGIGREARTEASLGGTRTNCAGGVTPWGTWLSCEENTSDYSSQGGTTHGYVFEVTADPQDTTANPIRDMGRFKHEAVCVDPSTSFVYLTEDSRNQTGYYRFMPHDSSQRTGSLEAGGRLQAARVKGLDIAMLLAPELGQTHQLEWVDIDEPDSAPVGGASGPYAQARDAGALTMSRGEGIWYHEGKAYIVDTSAGRDGSGAEGYGNGCVWMHDLASDTITCIFVSNNEVVANNPDNITVSPRGGVLLCEDGGGVNDMFGYGERVLGLTNSGEAFVFIKSNVAFTDIEAAEAGKNVSGGDYRNKEFAGACFDPSGHFLFVNVQTPGITFAIWGPWARGSL